MSHRGRNYNANRNQNYYSNTYINYSQSEENSSYGNWLDLSLPLNSSGGNQSLPQHSMTYIPNGRETYNEDLMSNEFYQSGMAGAHAPLFNMEINSEILARAANSQLTPTAGEFIPSSTYHSSVTSDNQDSAPLRQSSQLDRAQSGGSYKINETKRSVMPMESNCFHDQIAQQKRNFNKVKSRNTDTYRQYSIEQSKAEGRKRLLQEAAGLVQQKNDSSSSSRVENEFVGRQIQGTTEKVSQNNFRNSDAKVFNRSIKSQEHFNNHYQHYAPSSKSGSGVSPRRQRNYSSAKGVDDAVSQRDRLIDQLNRGILECLVCCDHVRQTDHTWSCNNCYHVLHLRCIVKWANTSKADNGWRCPACQNVTVAMPKDYYCFCNKAVNPEWNRSDTAHSCGEVCNRSKVLASQHYSCVHRCTLLCHPGPCPPCVALITRKCGCGQSSQTVQCGKIQPLVCNSICNKPLTCGIHKCSQKCHLGDCQPCQVVIKKSCYCGKESREVSCNDKTNDGEKFTCGKQCGNKLSCGQHECELNCHDGECGTCLRDPSQVTHCPCGKMLLNKEHQRKTCLDAIPTCNQTCDKQLSCGQPSSPHQCKSICHEGACPPCEQSTMVRCRCGFMDQEIPCKDLTSKADDARCQKKCTKKRICGKHKCNQMCCIDVDHVCPLPCNHMLSCGQHRCDQLCHRGHCQPCLQSSFEELFCECRTSVLYPPIPCGTKPPPCNEPCSRVHDCDHEVLHVCHSFPKCPPCGVLTSKFCYGKHELRKAVPCHMKEFSCGRPCGQALPCGRHKCIQLCHSGECGVICKQPCIKPRDLCGHPCNAPCHDGDCLETPCKENVVVTCECGYRSMTRPCFENNSEYQRIATSLLASKMADVQLGRSINLADMQGSRKISIKTLECSEECRIMERNRRLAIGLQIRNPDLSAKLTPRYSDFMRAWAKKDQRFCQHIHDKLTELVKLAKESKQKSRSYSFDTMNREKRQFVHEYCTHFGCESVAYDAEPKRNVVATAQKDKAWLPSYSLLEVVQREMGLRKVPLPNLNSTSQKSTPQSNVLPVRVALNQPVKLTSAADSPDIDYFDYNKG